MKDFVEQIFTPFKTMSEHIKYRLNNPLGIAFVFSWIIFNWQAVYYFMFSDDAASAKITYLQKIYLTNTEYDLSNLFWYPLFASVLYLVFAPLVSNIATGLWSVIDQSCTALRLKFVEKATLMTNADKAKMYLALNKIKADHEAEIEKLRNEISGLQSLLTLEREITSPSDIETPSDIERKKLNDLINLDYEGLKVGFENSSIRDYVPLTRELMLGLLNKNLTNDQRSKMLKEWVNEKLIRSGKSYSFMFKDEILKMITLLLNNEGEVELSVIRQLLLGSQVKIDNLLKELFFFGYIEQTGNKIRLTAQVLDSLVKTMVNLDKKESEVA